MSIRKLYPYHVPFKRTSDWWDSGGTWYQVSTWCTTNFRRRWEFLDEKFMFETEQDKAWFMLRWS
jgi:hypothetical protein